MGAAKKDQSTTSRLKDLGALKDELRKHYPGIDGWIREQLTVGQSTEVIGYPDYMKLTSGAEVYVDLLKISQDEGISYRIPEALFLNRKIITNRLVVRDEPFYDPDRVFLIGVDPLPRLQSFLEKEIGPLGEDVLKYYDASRWWTEGDPYSTREQALHEAHKPCSN